MILAFFAASDTIVNINLGERFIKEVQIREAIITYTYQMMMESVHSEVYSLMIDNIVRNPEEKHKLLNAITEYPCISKKAQWAQKWIESNAPFSFIDFRFLKRTEILVPLFLIFSASERKINSP